MTETAPSTTSLVRARRRAAAALVVLLASLPSPSRAQTPPPPPAPSTGSVTLQASPSDATIALHGPSDLIGGSPLDLGSDWTGRYRVVVQAPAHAAAEGLVYFPGPGGTPRVLSPPSGLHGRTTMRSLYFPGAAALLDGRSYRGGALLAAGVGGLGAVVHDQIEYGKDKDDADPFTRDRALDFQYARNRWALYTAVVWALSAIDNVASPRLETVEATPSRLTVRTPALSHTGVMMRALLVPGGGQDALGQKIRGAAWLGGTLLSGAAWVTAVESHRRIQTKLSEAKGLLATAPPGEVAIRQEDVAHFTKREDDSKKLVNRLALTTLAIYAANVIDAGFLNLGVSSAASGKMSLAPELDARGRSVSLRLRF